MHLNETLIKTLNSPVVNVRSLPRQRHVSKSIRHILVQTRIVDET